MTTRAEAKQLTHDRLLSVARERLREAGASELSLRDVARGAGITPSAVYKHFDNRDALLTALLIGSYRDLAAALHAEPAAGGDAWTRRANRLRAWALEHPQDFQLLYGTPVIGYAAPTETVEPAAAVADAFLELVDAVPEVPRPLTEQLTGAAAAAGSDPRALAWTLASLSHLVGHLMLELGGHFVGTAAPADDLWTWIVAGQQAHAA